MTLSVLVVGMMGMLVFGLVGAGGRRYRSLAGVRAGVRAGGRAGGRADAGACLGRVRRDIPMAGVPGQAAVENHGVSRRRPPARPAAHRRLGLPIPACRTARPSRKTRGDRSPGPNNAEALSQSWAYLTRELTLSRRPAGIGTSGVGVRGRCCGHRRRSSIDTVRSPDLHLRSGAYVVQDRVSGLYIPMTCINTGARYWD